MLTVSHKYPSFSFFFQRYQLSELWKDWYGVPLPVKSGKYAQCKVYYISIWWTSYFCVKILSSCVHWPSKCDSSVWLPVKIARRQKEVLKTHYPLDVSSQKSTKVCFSMTIGILKFPDPRNRDSISVINSKDTLLAILKVTDARRDVILAGGLNHRQKPCTRII